MDFTMRVAQRSIGVRALFENTREFCRDFLWDGEAEFTVAISQADIHFERDKSAREDALEGIPVRHFSDAYLETLAVQRKIAEALLEWDVLLFHGSAVAVDGEACLFTAKSGTGKSTHTRLWRQVFGERAVMVNDDKPFLRIGEDGVYACGSPWNGKHGLGTNISVPLKAICLLERGMENVITRLSAQDALKMLIQQSSRPVDPRKMGKYLELLDRVASEVRFYKLVCNMEPEAAVVAYEGIRCK